MAWIGVDLEETLVLDDGNGQSQPVPGAPEAMSQLATEGHRLTIHTAKFAPMPDDRRQAVKEEIESELASWGFPPMEVWTGTTKPSCDVFIGSRNITFDQNWDLALTQLQMMLEERGLAGAQTPGMGVQDDATGGEEPPQQEEP